MSCCMDIKGAICSFIVNNINEVIIQNKVPRTLFKARKVAGWVWQSSFNGKWIKLPRRIFCSGFGRKNKQSSWQRERISLNVALHLLGASNFLFFYQLISHYWLYKVIICTVVVAARCAAPPPPWPNRSINAGKGKVPSPFFFFKIQNPIFLWGSKSIVASRGY